MTFTAEEPVEDADALSAVEEIDLAIAAAKSQLQLLLNQRSRAAAAALPIPTLGVPLFPWQQRAIDSWRGANHRGVVQAVTGAGKTRVGVAAIAEALQNGRRGVVLVPSLVLRAQWLDTLRDLLPGVPVSDQIGDPKPWRVLVTTMQSAMNRPATPFGERALLVVDECHRAGAEVFSMGLRPTYDWRLGLTATLERGDDGDETLRRYFGPIVHDLGYREALDDELIAPFRFAHVSVPLLPHERNDYDELTEALRAARDRLVRDHGTPEEPVSAFLRAVSDLAQDRTPGSGGGVARFYMKQFAARRSLLAETPIKMLALSRLSAAVQASNGTIVFTQTKEASNRAAEVLRLEGCSSASVHGELDKESREERIDLFREGSVISLTAPRVLDEGVDVPEADLGIVMAANRSRRQMIQRLGRVLRRREGKTARFVVLYAADTVEDPFHRGHIPDFYEACLPFAEEAQRFDLSQDGDLEALLGFLGTAVDDAEPGRPLDLTGHSVGAGGEPTGTRQAVEERGEPTVEAEEALRDGGDEPTELLMGSLFSDDPVKDYLERIGKSRLLRASEEVALAQAIEAGVYARHLLDTGDSRFDERELLQAVADGHDAREEMICANLRLVVSLAKRYTGRGLEFLDLIQEGNIGLMHAVEKFDFTAGNKFSTYATWWIKQAITRGMDDQARTVRLPVHVHEVRRRLDRFRRDRGLTWSELVHRHRDGIAELDVDGTLVQRLAKLSEPLISLEGLAEEIDDSVIHRPLDGLDPFEAPEAVVDRMATRRMFDAIVGCLEHENPRNAFVLKARYGAITGENETLEAIGDRIGLTRERVRQIEKQTMDRAREIAASLEMAPLMTEPQHPQHRRLPAHSVRMGGPAVQQGGVAPRRADLSRAPGEDQVAPRRAA